MRECSSLPPHCSPDTRGGGRRPFTNSPLFFSLFSPAYGFSSGVACFSPSAPLSLCVCVSPAAAESHARGALAGGTHRAIQPLRSIKPNHRPPTTADKRPQRGRRGREGTFLSLRPKIFFFFFFFFFPLTYNSLDKERARVYSAVKSTEPIFQLTECVSTQRRKAVKANCPFFFLNSRCPLSDSSLVADLYDISSRVTTTMKGNAEEEETKRGLSRALEGNCFCSSAAAAAVGSFRRCIPNVPTQSSNTI